jgi:hypothetical protein
MTSHTEAREAVAAELLRQYQVEYQGGRIENCYDKAYAILARLGELGYVQGERLTSDAAVEAARLRYNAATHEQGDLLWPMYTAIAAAITKAGELRHDAT